MIHIARAFEGLRPQPPNFMRGFQVFFRILFGCVFSSQPNPCLPEIKFSLKGVGRYGSTRQNLGGNRVLRYRLVSLLNIGQ